MSRNLYALLVGINNYPKPVPPLHGCANDVVYFQQYLEARANADLFAFHPCTLIDEQATREQVIQQFQSHLVQAREQDVALFYYSGHGSQEPAPPEFWRLEPDHLDETLVLYDSRTLGGLDLADKEVGYLISQVAASGAHVVMIIDACHSGSATRAAQTETAIRWAPVDTRPRPLETYHLPASLREKLSQLPATSDGGSSGWFPLPEGRHILLAACQDRETAKEMRFAGQAFGAFSYHLLSALQAMTGPVTYRDVFNQARARVVSILSDQTPQIEVTQSGDMDQPFLGGAIRPRPPYFTISYEKRRGWTAAGGSLHGLQPPQAGETTRLAIFPTSADLTVSPLPQAITQAQVTQVGFNESRLQPDDP
ncbi:MAG: caspase family protein, partial [Omnitrophica WOR_2 bacterium]